MQGYMDKGLQRYRDIRIYEYMDTGIERYRDKEIQGNR